MLSKDEITRIVLKHEPGKHPQIRHGNRGVSEAIPDATDWMSMLLTTDSDLDKYAESVDSEYRKIHKKELDIIDTNIGIVPSAIKNHDDWAARSYKKGALVEVGDGGAVNSQVINEKRRAQRTRMYRSQIEDAAQQISWTVKKLREAPDGVIESVFGSIAGMIKQERSNSIYYFIDKMKVENPGLYESVMERVNVR